MWTDGEHASLAVAATQQQPLWITLLVAALGALVGGLFSLCGVWLTARSNRIKEGAERTARWDREDQQKIVDDRRQLIIDIAESVEERQSWVRSVDYGFKHDGAASLVAPKFQTRARIKIFGSAPLNRLWDMMDEYLKAMESEMLLGNVHADFETNRTELDNQHLAPAAKFYGDVLVLALRMMMETGLEKIEVDTLLKKVAGLRGINKDERYRKELDAWVGHVNNPESVWRTSWGVGG